MKDIVKFINQIPAYIDAKEPEQLRFLLNEAYNKDLSKETKVFDRNTDRFFIIKTWKVKSLRGWFRKFHILNLLYILNATHKSALLTKKENVKLDKAIKRADKKSTTLEMNGTQARAAYWGT